MYLDEKLNKLLLLAIIYVVILITPAHAEMSQDKESDAGEYINNCAVCHGLDGKGGGPMLDQLIKRPKDLTVLSQENGGSFPETVVYQIIDGRRISLAHGPREMPIWGKRFRSSEGNEEYVDERISRIIRHIQSLQY